MELEQLYGLAPVRCTHSFTYTLGLQKDMVRYLGKVKLTLSMAGIDDYTVDAIMNAAKNVHEDDDIYYDKVIQTITTTMSTPFQSSYRMSVDESIPGTVTLLGTHEFSLPRPSPCVLPPLKIVYESAHGGTQSSYVSQELKVIVATKPKPKPKPTPKPSLLRNIFQCIMFKGVYE